MIRGQIAKKYVTDKIRETFGDAFIGEVDKKLIIETTENGERIQVALALTCPKTLVEKSGAPAQINGVLDFTQSNVVIPKKSGSIITDEEKENISKMMERLGL